MPIWIIVASAIFALLLVAGLGLLILRRLGDRVHPINQLVASFHGSVEQLAGPGRQQRIGPHGEPRGPSLLFRGREWTAEMHQPSRGLPSFSLHTSLVVVPQPSPGRPHLRRLPKVLLRRERWLDRVGKALLLNRELQLGDPDFDPLVYVESLATDAELAVLLRSPRLRAAAVRLFRNGVSEVRFNHDGQGVSLWWRKPYPSANFTPQAIQSATEDATYLCEELPTFESIQPQKGWPPGSLLVASSVVSWVAAMATWALARIFQPLGPHSLFLAFALPGLVFACLMMIVTVIRVRGSPSGLRVLLWTAVLGVIGYPGLSVGSLVVMNGLLSPSPETYNVQVMDRRVSSGKQTYYYLVVAPVPPLDGAVEIRLPYEDYRSHPPASHVQIRVGEGLLGLRWFAGVAE